ncbi:MAG: class I SAM-dependent methyltransferase [Candidatus Falkowbacteria bacterium]|nr:class I SAM-dependent methyltransferase [Candidatus Falkowbacteria bacterium]
MFDERFEINALSKSTLTYSEHVVRYQFASRFVQSKVVLDIACGSGYGSQILALAGAAQVIGVDIDKQAIDLANSKNQSKNINYINSDATKLNLGNESIDVIVSFETIEHLKNPEEYLKELKRVLKVDGIALISTPNLEVSKNHNPFHIKEYTKDEFTRLLQGSFQESSILDQFNVLTSVIKTDYTNPGEFDIIKDIPNPEYFIAICAKKELKMVLGKSIASLNKDALEKLRSNPGLKIADTIYSFLTKIKLIKN